LILSQNILQTRPSIDFCNSYLCVRGTRQKISDLAVFRAAPRCEKKKKKKTSRCWNQGKANGSIFEKAASH
jgi:hypothetical protein